MRSVAAVAVAGTVVALLVAGAAMSSRTVPAQPTLVVVAVGSGSVTSNPTGISCPGRCTATFAAGTTVALTPKSKNGSPFLRWGGSCTGSEACKVRVSSLAVVGAQFASGAKTVPQPTPQTSVAAPGPYEGADVGSISFYVSPDGRSMLNISVPLTSVNCTQSGGLNDRFEILKAAIKPSGSFNATTSQDGVLGSSTAKFSYNIAGHFRAATASTAASAAGTWREDIAYTSGPTRKCTTNAQSWTATLVREPPQQKLLVKPGNYSGADVDSITFSVAPDAKSIQNASVKLTALNCASAGGLDDHFEILKATIKPDGSFNATTSQNGVLNGTMRSSPTR